MSIKGSRVKTAKVACVICGKEFTKSGLVGHKRFIHSQSALNARLSDIIPDDLQSSKAALEAQLSDVQNALEASKTTISELKAALSDVHTKLASDDFRTGIIKEWISTIDAERWLEIAEINGLLSDIKKMLQDRQLTAMNRNEGKPTKTPKVYKVIVRS
jgi:hypothetical protein